MKGRCQPASFSAKFAASKDSGAQGWVGERVRIRAVANLPIGSLFRSCQGHAPTGQVIIRIQMTVYDVCIYIYIEVYRDYV